jgi:pyridoxamine 5'-phosphate oxidase family protein
MLRKSVVYATLPYAKVWRIGMSVFTDAERAYLRDEHPIARLATVGADGTPHVMPIGMYRLDEASDVIDTMGHRLTSTKKWRDVIRSGRAAVVVDDVRPPFQPRGIEVRGRAEAVDGPEPVIRIHPERIVAWGLDETETMRNARDVEPP